MPLADHPFRADEHAAWLARKLAWDASQRSSDAMIETELGEWTKRVRDVVFYARAAARTHGYALAVHGSLRRDVDVVAVPWTAEAVSPERLAREILDFLVTCKVAYGWGTQGEHGDVRPHGRRAWSIVLAGDPFLYLDLSVAGIVAAPHAARPKTESEHVPATQSPLAALEF